MHLSCAYVLHLLVHSFMRKSAQSNSPNGQSDAALKGTFHGGVNVVLEDAP